MVNIMKVKNEDCAAYGVTVDHGKRCQDDKIIEQAIKILEGRMRKHGEAMISPQTVKDFFRLKLAELEHEVFVAIFLDAQNRLIEYSELFSGTLTQASVYPREVVKAALKHNAAAVIFAHNHPSGEVKQSRADETMTSALKDALALVDVKVLDHIIVGGMAAPLSFAEKGLI